MRYKVWIDRGGTFTDCIGVDSHTGGLTIAKVLSSDNSVIDGIRRVFELRPDQPIMPCEVRMGTTIATNALLERKGQPCVLVTSRGFGDVLEIGTQQRPDLFALAIRKPKLLYHEVIEVDARGTPSGKIIANYDADELLRSLQSAKARGIRSAAVVLLHAHKNGAAERDIGELVRRAGFEHVALSHEVVQQIGLLARGDTTTVDAYLTPLIRDHLNTLSAALPGSTIRVMQSSGGLTSADRLRGPHAILSGPAGGVVAYARIAAAAGFANVIGFDMGGTSTDVSRFAGAFERAYENEIAGVRLRAPMLAIHTVAAGGGSLCRYDGQKFTVGPESAGATPGPLCYGASDASELTVTDINLMLGRLHADRFPFALDRIRPTAALETIAEQLRAQGRTASAETAAGGFFEIANLNMAEAIRRVSVQKGYDVREHALFVFGGAGGQHACAIAAELGMRAVLFHGLSGVLSAYGMGLADLTVHREADAGPCTLTESALNALEPAFRRLEAEARRTLDREGCSPTSIDVERSVDLRYRGTDTALTLSIGPASELARRFAAAHMREFGYDKSDHDIEVVELRLTAIASGRAVVETGEPSGAPLDLPEPTRRSRLWHANRWLDQVPLFHREQLRAGHRLVGPALILEATGTIVLDPGFHLEVRGPLMVAEPLDARTKFTSPVKNAPQAQLGKPDPVLLEVMNHSYVSIAEQMGEVLRRTAISTNIRERLDFSCAVFDHNARLIANAPHIPVHLGAMGESVKAVVQANPHLEPGDVFVTNDPAHGGSHLPDITVVSPVYDSGGGLSFFVASRGHHADIGGITPGSMPPHSRFLEEEGVLLPARRIVHRGVFDRRGLEQSLTGARYPARDPRRNIADIEAQIAANQLGSQRLTGLVELYGLVTVTAYMHHVQLNAEHQVRRAIAKLSDGRHEFEDQLDAGARIRVALTISDTTMHIDFTGTDPELASNLNAPRAVTIAAVIYFLRTLVDLPIPLNAGCLNPVQLTIPEGSLLSPSPRCAVVGGNVETSQRIVDVLLAAAGKAAASQGTMNNLSFGNDRFGYYETIAGGAGAGDGFGGASAVHTHMTNTRITDAEILESNNPVRVVEFSRRRGSGGDGAFRGGDGVVRELEFLEPLEVSLLTERRVRQPFGLFGGSPGLQGRNLLNGKDIPGAVTLKVAPHDRLRLETPGGGGFGTPELGIGPSIR